jgi:hypothetical protein
MALEIQVLVLGQAQKFDSNPPPLHNWISNGNTDINKWKRNPA